MPAHTWGLRLKSSCCGEQFVKWKVSPLAKLATCDTPQTGSRRRTRCPRSNGIWAYRALPTWNLLSILGSNVQPSFARSNSIDCPPSMFMAVSRAKRRDLLITTLKW
jgi:hypothetical protein